MKTQSITHHIVFRIVITMRGNGKTMKEMEKGFKFGKMDQRMKAIGRET